MTEQRHSAEAQALAETIYKWQGHAFLDGRVAEAIDALIAQRVSAETERCAGIAQEAADYVRAGPDLAVIPARIFASDLALDIRDAIRAQGKQT